LAVIAAQRAASPAASAGPASAIPRERRRFLVLQRALLLAQFGDELISSADIAASFAFRSVAY